MTHDNLKHSLLEASNETTARQHSLKYLCLLNLSRTTRQGADSLTKDVLKKQVILVHRNKGSHRLAVCVDPVLITATRSGLQETQYVQHAHVVVEHSNQITQVTSEASLLVPPPVLRGRSRPFQKDSAEQLGHVSSACPTGTCNSPPRIRATVHSTTAF